MSSATVVQEWDFSSPYRVESLSSTACRRSVDTSMRELIPDTSEAMSASSMRTDDRRSESAPASGRYFDSFVSVPMLLLRPLSGEGISSPGLKKPSTSQRLSLISSALARRCCSASSSSSSPSRSAAASRRRKRASLYSLSALRRRRRSSAAESSERSPRSVP